MHLFLVIYLDIQVVIITCVSFKPLVSAQQGVAESNEVQENDVGVEGIIACRLDDIGRSMEICLVMVYVSCYRVVFIYRCWFSTSYGNCIIPFFRFISGDGIIFMVGITMEISKPMPVDNEVDDLNRAFNHVSYVLFIMVSKVASSV